MSVFQTLTARWDHLARACVAVIASGVAVLGFAGIEPEFSAHKLLIQGSLAAYRGDAQELAQTAASVEGVYERLQACDGALTDLITLLQPSDKRAEVATACLSAADAVLQSAPTMSMAHLIKAVSLRELGQTAAARDALLLSEVTGGGNVQYAQRRAAIWADEIGTLGPDEIAALQRDVLRLTAMAAGMAWLAGKYTQIPALRPVLTKAINTLPEKQQAAFLASVRRLSQ